jgi:hypothetical protein
LWAQDLEAQIRHAGFLLEAAGAGVVAVQLVRAWRHYGLPYPPQLVDAWRRRGPPLGRGRPAGSGYATMRGHPWLGARGEGRSEAAPSGLPGAGGGRGGEPAAALASRLRLRDHPTARLHEHVRGPGAGGVRTRGGGRAHPRLLHRGRGRWAPSKRRRYGMGCRRHAHVVVRRRPRASIPAHPAVRIRAVSPVR